MAPLIRDGDRVFIDPNAYRRRPPRAGDIVLSRHPFRADTVLVKSVREVGEGDRVFLIGTTGSPSTDSRSFGPVLLTSLLGKVVSTA
jgi:nickel-type superoxide dismutase maturation protease